MTMTRTNNLSNTMMKEEENVDPIVFEAVESSINIDVKVKEEPLELEPENEEDPLHSAESLYYEISPEDEDHDALDPLENDPIVLETDQNFVDYGEETNGDQEINNLNSTSIRRSLRVRKSRNIPVIDEDEGSEAEGLSNDEMDCWLPAEDEGSDEDQPKEMDEHKEVIDKKLRKPIDSSKKRIKSTGKTKSECSAIRPHLFKCSHCPTSVKSAMSAEVHYLRVHKGT